MKAITYRNTKTTLPNYEPIHETVPCGYAYELETHFVHFYGHEKGFHNVSVGTTVIEQKSGTLEDWVKKTFGAEDIKEMNLTPGTSIEDSMAACFILHGCYHASSQDRSI